ncbi:MAG: hypothetical protein UY70_C0001G0024 [Candidatus Kaiserbacteria bacterium GW2011_GWB1_52_6]|uniref:Methyltransferase domain-containing protein n=3 Tax=Candidatus Kaiseribacteriota TaxID=1752734 RepID=A0A0G1ZSE8_9BACT|nr:MAG: hypothetical protein UY67_C0007G0024 [Candidatus Kaiserbacteria bacterium GW2011_GWA2_52_12]KKW28188.1 MAG: hypothetical protein UY70_C0001G0024 [Candidatus Kaiserbacteria bacterium GW2011_GWB1_52_6]KKW31157.1 MAG: hypothetical protein UY74_C0022G0013 [Candidatus Kaiserbacteria bacterium GW2011_GWC2_52_8b]
MAYELMPTVRLRGATKWRLFCYILMEMQKTAHHHSTTSDGRLSVGRQGFAHPHTNVGALGIGPGMAVADFGSGSGHYALAIAEALEGSGHIYAIDVQRDLLRRTHNEATKRGFKNVQILWGDLETSGGSKIADKHLDLVLISNLLFQVENKDAVLQEAARVLRPQGRLAIIDWSESFGGMGPVKNDVVAKNTALALANNHGFGLEREFSAGAHHYGLVFKSASHRSRTS